MARVPRATNAAPAPNPNSEVGEQSYDSIIAELHDWLENLSAQQTFQESKKAESLAVLQYEAAVSALNAKLAGELEAVRLAKIDAQEALERRYQLQKWLSECLWHLRALPGRLFKQKSHVSSNIGEHLLAEMHSSGSKLSAELDKLSYIGGTIGREDTVSRKIPDAPSRMDILERRIGKEATDVVREIFPELNEQVEAKLAIPTSAPELWASDKQPGENPVAFFDRVYAPWREQIAKPDVRRLDKGLYQAMATWVRRHPEDDPKLPTLKDQNDAWVARIETEGRPAFGSMSARDASKLAGAIHRRKGRGES